MAETYKDIKRQLDNLTWGNPVECEYFEHSAGCEGCPAEGAYCDRKMVIHLAKRVRKATKREFNIKATESLGFPSVGKDTRVAELERDLATVISQRDQTNDTLKSKRYAWYAQQDVYEKCLKARNERIEELENELRDAQKVSAKRDEAADWVEAQGGLDAVKKMQRAFDYYVKGGDTIDAVHEGDCPDGQNAPWAGFTAGGCYFASGLPYPLPDTQERIDDDATLHPEVYCVYILHIESSELGDYSECTEAMALDLLRRQRELCAKGGE